MATFVLSDENIVNSYGFRVSTKGIGLKRFKKNPVMLSEHWNSVSAVLGRWTNIKKDDSGLLTAEDEFDEEDADAAKIKGKVDRGFLKGASIGITFNRDHMQLQADGTYLLTKCELMEASICAIPSNANALKLYAETGELMDEETIRLSLSNTNLPNFKTENKEAMKKVILTLTALMALDLQAKNTQEGVNVDDVNAAIDKLKADFDKANNTVQTLKAANESLTAQLATLNKEKVSSLIDQAIADGKLSATEKESWEQLATANYELAVKTLSGITAKSSLSATVHNTGKGGEIKTIDDFVKLPLNEQLAFKANHPQEYQALFK